MVQPTPFQRMLQDVSKEARSSPEQAFAKLDELYGKTLVDTDVLALGAFATNLGGAALGRFDDTAALIRRCLGHPVVTPESSVRRSLNRALAVLMVCADRMDEAEAARRIGVTSPAEECRFAGACAQTLLARNRGSDAMTYFKQATRLCRDLPANDEVVIQTAGIAANLLRVAEPQCRLAHDLLTAAAEASLASEGRSDDWRIRHRALFNHGKSWLLAGHPMRALASVQRMMELEAANEASAVERFYSANLACRSQATRGQFKVAAMAQAACIKLARDAEQAGEPMGPALEDLERFVASMKA